MPEQPEDILADLIDAYDGWREADRRLKELLRRARDEGHSVNLMAGLLGAPVMNIWRW